MDDFYEVNSWTKCSVRCWPFHFLVSFLHFGVHRSHCPMSLLRFTWFYSRFISFRGTSNLRFATLVCLFHWTLACMSSFCIRALPTLHVFVWRQSTWTDQCHAMDGPLITCCCRCQIVICLGYHDVTTNSPAFFVHA